MIDPVVWFSPDEPPEFDTPIFIRIGRSVFRGGAILHRTQRRLVWCRQRGHRMVLLRRVPDAWRPVKPGQDVRRVSRPSKAFLALQEQQNAPPQPEAAPPLEPRAWWLDGALVRYSPPGAITPRECEGRLMRALLTARVTKMESPKGPGSNSDWIAKMIAKVEIETGARPRATYWHDRHQPSARDISDCTVAIDWLRGISSIRTKAITAQMYQIIDMRNRAYSYRAISEMDGMPNTSEKVARVYRAAMMLVLRWANGVRDADDGRPAKATVAA